MNIGAHPNIPVDQKVSEGDTYIFIIFESSLVTSNLVNKQMNT